MKSMRLIMGGVIALALTLSLSETAMATEKHNPPPPTPQPIPVVNNIHPEANAEASALARANAEANATAIAKQQQSMEQQQQQRQHQQQTAIGGAGGQGGKGGAGGDAHSSSDATIVVEEGAFAPEVNGGSAIIEEGAIENNVTGGSLTLAAGAIAPRTGDVVNEIEIVDKSKNINVMMVPPGLPSLAPAPVITECANCYIDFLFSAQEISGATTQSPPQVIKGKDIQVSKDTVTTVTSMALFPGVRKTPGNFGVLPVTVNRVPATGTYQSVAMINVQAAKRKDGYMLTPMELQIRVLQAAQRLNFPDDTVLYVVFSRKATIQHATLVTTGKGWSFAPGGGGSLSDAMIGSIIGTVGNSSGTATNDWTPEVTALVIIPKAGGVESGAFNALDHQVAETISVSK